MLNGAFRFFHWKYQLHDRCSWYILAEILGTPCLRLVHSNIIIIKQHITEFMFTAVLYHFYVLKKMIVCLSTKIAI